MKHTCKNNLFITKKQAFTLIELLIVIAIIGILFIVLVSKVDFATDKAKATGVQTDFRSFQMAFDTVAKENAGFNTFGWDTGDLNQDGIRNSYDEGDNGAGGGIAHNGIQDGTEVFTGHKVYAETFTKVFSLKKNGTGSYDRDALNRLEAAINANLDPKLHVTIKDDGEIVMANGAQDPWNKEYHGWYITNAEDDGLDRGAIGMYSDGANNEFGSEHSIANGIVSISIPGDNKWGKDDYAIASIYTYLNGYGEVKNITTGFSNNQTINGGNIADMNGDISDTPNTPEQVELVEGLYDADDNLLISIDDLKSQYGWDPTTSVNYSNSKHITTIVPTHFPTATKIIVDKLENPYTYLFRQSTLETAIIRDTNKTRGMFWEFKGKYVEIGGNINTLESEALRDCPNLIEAKIPDTIIYYDSSAVRNVPNLTTLNISPYTKKLYSYSLNAIALQTLPVFYDLEYMADNALLYNHPVESITFGDKLTYFGNENLYAYNEKTTTITFTGLIPPTTNTYTWSFGSRNVIIQVPAESIELYKEAFAKVAHLIVPIE